MAAQPIYVDTEEEIPELIERLRRTSASEIPVVLPIRSRVAQSRFNLQLLRDYAERLGKRVAIISPEPAIQRMSQESGLAAFAAIADYERAPASAFIPAPVQAAVAARTEPGVERVQRVTSLSEPTGPVARGLIQRPAARTVGHGSSINRRILYTAAVILLAAGMLASLLLVPTATISLNVQAKPLSHITDSIQAAPDSPPIHVRLISGDRQSSNQFKTTGVRITPAQYATGSVVLNNNCDGGYTLINGTRVTTASGIVFAVLGDQPVNRHSNVTAPVQAANPGVGGNVPANTVNGFVHAAETPGCFTVTNPAAMAGGADEKKDQFLSQTDMDAAKAQVDGQLRAQLADDLAKQAGAGEKLTDTFDYHLDFATDHKVGENVTAFSGTATQRGTGIAYSDTDVHNVLVAELRKAVPTGYVLADSPVDVTYKVLSATMDGRIDMTGSAKGYISPHLDEDQIRSRLALQSTASATVLLRALPVDGFTIHQKPFPLPFLPPIGSHIHFEYLVKTNDAGAPAP